MTNPELVLNSLDRLREQVVKFCYKCKLRTPDTNIVFGDGNPFAKLMLVGEGPGEIENETGIPFTGPAGVNKLNKALEILKVPRDLLYITNVVLCRPPNNRTPEKSECEACRPRLDRQIEIISPKVIIALGSSAGQVLIDDDYRVTRDHGIWFSYKGIPVIGTFHPAYFLHQESVIKKMRASAERLALFKELRRDMEYFLEDFNIAIDKADELDTSYSLRRC